MTTRSLAGRAIAGAALSVLVLAAPATADRGGYDDPADATASLTDIRAVSIVHGAEQLAVAVSFTDLRATSDAGPSGMTVFLDSDPARKGPEAALVTGLQSGTDYALVRVRDWRPLDRRIDCDHQLRLRPRQDVARLRLDRACLGDPAKVRVSVKMVDQYDASHPVVDWVRAFRRFTPWVRSA